MNIPEALRDLAELQRTLDRAQQWAREGALVRAASDCFRADMGPRLHRARYQLQHIWAGLEKRRRMAMLGAASRSELVILERELVELEDFEREAREALEGGHR